MSTVGRITFVGARGFVRDVVVFGVVTDGLAVTGFVVFDGAELGVDGEGEKGDGVDMVGLTAAKLDGSG